MKCSESNYNFLYLSSNVEENTTDKSNYLFARDEAHDLPAFKQTGDLDFVPWKQKSSLFRKQSFFSST